MNHVLGSRLFALADTAGMMSEGYAWIITDSLSIYLNSFDSNGRDSMDGVLGIRPYVNAMKKLKSFQERWKKDVLLKGSAMELNIYGLWAYDAVTALAIAVENIKPELDSSLLHANGTDKRTGMRISSFGPRLISELSSTKFRGLAGDFQLVDGALKSSAYEIFNLIGNGERRVGFWSPERGITRELSEQKHSTSTKELKTVVWPGDSVTQPKGWTISPTGSLRIGVPWKPGFKEFVNVVIDPATNDTHITGFVIDIFVASWKWLNLPINYTYHCYNDSSSSNWSYDSMLHKIPQEFDMIVADTTIWSPRSLYVDFSLPYSESGVVLVVKNTKPIDMWIFIRPLRWDLWLAIVLACILVGVVLQILEHRATRTGEESIRQHPNQLGSIYSSPIEVLAFQERGMVLNKWSVFVLVCWMFMTFILMQSFTANLSAMLTVDQLQFAFSDKYFIGYHEGSFMKNFLTEHLNINGSKLRAYASPEAFHNAMSRGSKNGGVDAIFDEIPYMKLFLNRYQSQYKIVGPTYRTAGLGFAFPTGSPLVANFSRAILNVTQGPLMNVFEQRNFGPGYSSQDPLSSVISQGTSSLTLHEFAGLFIIAASFLLFALFCSETAIGRKLTNMTGNFVQNRFSFFRTSPTTEGASVVGGNENNESAQDNVDTPPGEIGNAQVLGDEAQEDAEEIVETDLSNETSATEDAGVGSENHLSRNSSTRLNQGSG